MSAVAQVYLALMKNCSAVSISTAISSVTVVSTAVQMIWCITIPLGCLCAFILRLPVLVVYFVLNLDEIVKLPVVYRHYRKYVWVKNIT